jgi:hypothetical protein
VFNAGRRRITGARFSHSEIRGSMAIQRLTAAYRSRSRPSSTLGAKASTICPYYLDGDLAWRARRLSVPRTTFAGCHSVIPVYIGYCAVFKVRKEARAPSPPARDQDFSPLTGARRAGLSKLNSMRSPHLALDSASCVIRQVRSTCLVDRMRSDFRRCGAPRGNSGQPAPAFGALAWRAP